MKSRIGAVSKTLTHAISHGNTIKHGPVQYIYVSTANSLSTGNTLVCTLSYFDLSFFHKTQVIDISQKRFAYRIRIKRFFFIYIDFHGKKLSYETTNQLEVATAPDLF